MEPNLEDLPTGHELVDEYLVRWRRHWAMPSPAPGSSRSPPDIDKTRGRARDSTPSSFESPGRTGLDDLPASVIDASARAQPNRWGGQVCRPGDRGRGERHHHAAAAVTGAMIDSPQSHLVVGAGHSAANTLLDLADLAREVPRARISWAVRSADVSRVYGGEDRDELAARGALGSRLRALVESGVVDVHTSFTITGFEAAGGRLRVLANGTTGSEELTVDLLVPATGFRPDLSMLTELRLELDPAVEAPRRLGPLIDPELHSCGSVEPHGESVLSHPDAGFYIVGMKSYGRAPTFLMATGYEQVRFPSPQHWPATVPPRTGCISTCRDRCVQQHRPGRIV